MAHQALMAAAAEEAAAFEAPGPVPAVQPETVLLPTRERHLQFCSA